MFYFVAIRIVECQFLLSFMSEAKDLGHGLYEIERNSEFVHDLAEIMEITQNKQQELFLAVHSGDNEDAQRRLGRLVFCYQNNIDCSKLDKNGVHSVHYVLEEGNKKLAEILFDYIWANYDNKEIKKLINTPTRNAYGYYPIHLACEKGKLELLKLFLSYGKDKIKMGVTNEFGQNVFLYSCHLGYYDIAEYLFKNRTKLKFDATAKDKRNEDALYGAIEKSQYKIAKMLLDSKLFNQINIQSTAHRLSMSLLSVCAITRYGYDSDNSESCDNFRCFKLLLNQPGIDVNLAGKDNVGPLLYLVARRKYIFIKYMIDNNERLKLKLDILARDEVGSDALRKAIWMSAFNILKLLLHTGKFEINRPAGTDFGTPIAVCASLKRGGHRKKAKRQIFEYLLSNPDNLGCLKDINPNICNKYGLNALLYSVIHNKYDYVKFLTNNDGKFGWTLDYNVSDGHGRNAITLAVRNSSPKMLKCLLHINHANEENNNNNNDNDNNNNNKKKKQFDINVVDSDGFTPLIHCAAIVRKDPFLQKLNFSCFKLLLQEKNINAAYKNEKSGDNVVTWCMMTAKTDYIEYLTQSNGKYGWKIENENFNSIKNVVTKSQHQKPK